MHRDVGTISVDPNFASYRRKEAAVDTACRGSNSLPLIIG